MCNLTPVIPARIFADSIARMLLGYTKEELLQLTRIRECDAFEWRTGM
jgi:hypothetical protein